MTAWFRRRPAADDAGAARVDRDLVAWAGAAARVSGDLGQAGAFAILLLGESLTRPRRSPWFGHEPDAEGLTRLLAALGEERVDVAVLMRAEEPLCGRHLGPVPPELVADWRQRLSESATRFAARGSLPDRHGGHIAAEEVWTVAASEASRPPLPVLDPGQALSQLRWFPGVRARTFVGYSDPLGLGTVQRATTEAGATSAQRDAQAAAQRVVDAPVDRVTWRLSSLAFAARHRPWELV